MSESAFRFKIVVASRDSMRWLPRALDSIRRQSDGSFDVCVVDDASTDPEQAPFVEQYCRREGWEWLVNTSRQGAMYSQYHAVQALAPEAADVIVFVDGDDRLAHDRVLERLRSYYCDDVLLTYGSYVCDPPDACVTPALPFYGNVVAANAYRAFSARPDPEAIWFNHLRTVRHELFSRLDAQSDLRFPDGEWFPACCDSAVMLPCLELAGGRFRWIPEVLYVYTRDNPLSEARVHADDIRRTHDYILHTLTPKEPLAEIRLYESGYGPRLDAELLDDLAAYPC
jgi:glycosyltransferase involved in cell wall biosynthesis